jgi:hypothetical protein
MLSFKNIGTCDGIPVNATGVSMEPVIGEFIFKKQEDQDNACQRQA